MISFNKKIFCIFCIFIIALTARFIGIYAKQSFFFDEVFTFISSTPNNLSPDGVKFKKAWNNFEFISSKNYTCKQLKKSYFENKADFNSLIQDIKTIRNANIDRQHTNLYYSIIRICNNGIDGTNLNQLKNRALYLNIIFFCLSFFFLYKLLSLIKDDTKFISLGIFFAFLSSGSICNSLLIRDYQLMETFLIGTVLLAFLFVKSIINNSSVSLKLILSFAFVLALFSLSNYFSLIFSTLLFLFLFCFCILKKKYNYIKYIPIILFIAFLFIILIYPSYFNFQLNNEHYIDVKNNFINLFSANLNTFKLFFNFLDIYLFYIEFLLTAGLFIFISFFKPIKKFILDNSKLNKYELSVITVLIGISVIYSIIVLFLTPIKHVRFIFATFPIFSMLFIILFYRFKTTIIIFIMSVYLIFSYCSFKFFERCIPQTSQYIYSPDTMYDILPQNADISSIPIVVINPISIFFPFYFNLTPENTIFRFEDKIPDENFIFNEYIIFLNDNQLLGLETRPKKNVQICLFCKCYYKKPINLKK